MIFRRFYKIASNCFLSHCVLFSFRKHLQKQWVVCGFYMPFKHLFVCLNRWKMLIPGLQLIHPKNVRSSPRIDAIERSNSRCRSWGLVGWIRWGFQALQGCLLSVASESKNCIQIRMVHEETSKKKMLASLTKQVHEFFWSKKHLKCASTSNEKKCLQLCMMDIYLDLTGKTMDPSQVALVASAPKTRRVHLLWSNHEAVLRKNLPRSPGGFGDIIAEVDKLTHHSSFHLIWGFGKKQFQYVC